MKSSYNQQMMYPLQITQFELESDHNSCSQQIKLVQIICYYHCVWLHRITRSYDNELLIVVISLIFKENAQKRAFPYNQFIIIFIMERSSNQKELPLVGEDEEFSHQVDVQGISQNFQNLMKAIQKKKQGPNFQDIKQHYNIRNYNVQKLHSVEIRIFHAQIIQKYRTKKMKRTWCENELRLFVWVLFYFEHSMNIPIEEFKEQDWNRISSIFVNKGNQDCKFEWLSLMKQTKISENWSNEEDILLCDIIKKHKAQNKWNQIAKQLYRISNSRYFRKPKQCRERWRNYLDPKIQKGQWTDLQDHRLLELSLQFGKKWSHIAKCMQSRTEHSVKNRYNSLFKKYMKMHPKKPRKKLQDYQKQAIKAMLKEFGKVDEDEKLEQDLEKGSELPVANKKIKIGFREFKQPKKQLQVKQDINFVLSPLTPFAYPQKTKPLGSLMFITSPRTKSPRFRSILDWNNVNKFDDYFF